MKKPNLGPDKGTTGKELSKSPFKKIGNDLQSEIEHFHKLITKIVTKHPLAPEAEMLIAFEKELGSSKDPVGTWIKANALEQLGYTELAAKFKEKATLLGYKINSVMEGFTDSETFEIEVKQNGRVIDHLLITGAMLRQIKSYKSGVTENYNPNEHYWTVQKATSRTGDVFEIGSKYKDGNGTLHTIKNMYIATNGVLIAEAEEGGVIQLQAVQKFTESSKLNGKKIKLIAIKENVENIAAGTEGTIINHDLESDIISVKWDNGETTPILPEDKFEVLPVKESCEPHKFPCDVEDLNNPKFTQHLPLENATKLTAGNELTSQSKQPLEDEPEYSENALVALIRNDVFLSFAFDQAQTDDRAKDLDKFYKHYIKGDEKMEHILKTFEKIHNK